MHFAAENLMRHRAADQGRGDVVEKTGKQPHHRQQYETALPVMRKIFRQHCRHVTLLEMARQQREPHQQTKQIGEDDPFVLDMSDKAHRAFTGLKTGEKDLVGRDRRQAAESNAHGVLMKHRDAKQGYPKQDEIDRDAEDGRILRRHGNTQSRFLGSTGCQLVVAGNLPATFDDAFAFEITVLASRQAAEMDRLAACAPQTRSSSKSDAVGAQPSWSATARPPSAGSS